jgi:allophanate hydrolase subunit 1
MTDAKERRQALTAAVQQGMPENIVTTLPNLAKRTVSNVVDQVAKVVEAQAQELFVQYRDQFIADEAARRVREIRAIEMSEEGDREEYIEYGISYRDEAPRARTFTPYYDDAMRDVAHRLDVHPDMGPITVKQRRNQLISSPWTDAKRPEFNPVIDRPASVTGTTQD